MAKYPFLLSTRRFQLIFIVLTVFLGFSPCLSTKFCSVDDLTMIHGMISSKFSWITTFLPGDIYYYRPFLKLSFRFDQWAWGFIPAFMHLENLLFHLINAVLVYFITERFWGHHSQSRSAGPWLAALLFGLHPLATESVNWISGRTDPLAALFVFLSVLALFRALETGRCRWLIIASLAFSGGTLVKEVMVFFLPAALILIWSYPKEGTNETMALDRRKASIVFCLPLVLFLGVFLAVRWVVQGEAAMGISDMLARNRYAPLHLGWLFFQIFGFYVKKLFWPMPLNFAINKISPHYAWLGLAAVGGLFFGARRRLWPWVPWIMAAVLLVPNFFIAMADVAWTPLAERYAYLAASFWAIGLVGLWSSLAPRAKCFRWLGVLLVVLIGIHTFTTIQRNRTWQSNVLLFTDTVAKSPEHIGARNELGNALYSRGQYAEAKREYEAGMALAGGSHPQLTFNLARVHLALKQPEQARNLLLTAIAERDKSGPPLSWLKILALADGSLLKEADNTYDMQRYGLELLDVYEAIYGKIPRPELLFQSGQLAQRIGEKQRAADLFARAYAAAPQGASYRHRAGELADELGNACRSK